MTKSFSIENPPEGASTKYHDELLRIINDIEKQVRSIEPDPALHNELHEQKYMDARAETVEFEPIRKDVCESFGVPDDGEHTYIHEGAGIGSQRALRAFFILIDTLSKESFYGEGRIDHNTLLEKLTEKLSRIDKDATSDSIMNTLDTDSLRYLVFKGFLSTKEFQELSESSRKILETPIVDKEGQKIVTPSTWFITGHNIPGKV